MTKTARVEIVAALHTRMLQHTDYPTPQDYKLVCQKLVGVYPTLADCNGSGYVSIHCYYDCMTIHLRLYNVMTRKLGLSHFGGGKGVGSFSL